MKESVRSASDTPVLFMIFNRPETTRQVFETIRKDKPRKLFIAADGPRNAVPGEDEKCREARNIATAVDWECETKTLFRDQNLGCGRGPAQAISWFFDHVDEGIILEDDCLPSPDFYLFCAELLERYRSDQRIMEIGGNNFLDAPHRDREYSYYFSNHNMIWGWATWKRAWKLYDFEMKLYKKLRNTHYVEDCFHSNYERNYFKWLFDKTVMEIENITWWDYQWEFARRTNSGLVIVPQKTLVINIGIGGNATHTTNPQGAGCNLMLETINFPLKHPDCILADFKKDAFFFRTTFTTAMSRMKSDVKRIMPRFIYNWRSQFLNRND